MLFSGKFNSMFSLLFRIGFTIQFARLEQKDPAHATGIYLRRLAVLAVLELIHGAIFWPGGCAGRSGFQSSRPGFAHGCGYWISRPAMMIFYVLLIVRLAQDPRWEKRLAPFGAAGRMPLTNYLMQTALCTTIFFGWGFGLWGKVGPAAGLLLALTIIFAIQVPWSTWWLNRNDRGPMEQLWAWMTYGSRSVKVDARAA